MRGVSRLLALAAAVSAVALPATASAATESGDAGELPASAQNLGADPTLDAIDGTIDGLSDRDVYRVCLSGAGTFSASTVGGAGFDTQLFLLDADGRGVYANDEAPGAVGQSQLPAGDPLTPAAAGVYFLAISRYNQDPRAGSEPLFADVNETTGPISDAPIDGWSSGREGATGAYRIALTGVVGCATPDLTAPTIEVRTPADGAVYTLGETVLADYDCGDEPGGSGVASCVGDVADGEPIDTSSIGSHSFSVSAADAAGNERTRTVGYSVRFAFDGFLPPLANPPAVNHVRAGSVVPVRFRLGGFQGHDVLARRYPRSAQVPCDFGVDADPAQAEPTRWAWWWGWWWHGQRGLRYRHSKGFYEYRWKTERGWAGQCRQLIVKLDDGSVQRANVEFPRRWRPS